MLVLCSFTDKDGVAVKRMLTIDEVISLARRQSVDAEVALNQLKQAYWEYRTYRAELLPELTFSGNLPDYNKSYSSYQASDGSYNFVRSNTIGMNGNLSMTQNVWLTGAKISVHSSLDYLKQIGGDGSDRYYMSVPAYLSITQPVFAVNDVKWDRKIEPLAYKKAMASFVSASEEVTMTAITNFFSLVKADESVKIAKQNLENANKLFEAAQVKRMMGKISNNDLLQLQQNMLEAKADLTDALSSRKSAMFTLRSFLAIPSDDELVPVVPDEIQSGSLAYEDVLGKALENNPLSMDIARRRLEADYAVAKAKGKRFDINLVASVGLTGVNNDLRKSYSNLKNYQVVTLGVQIPLLDWGKRKGEVKTAESNRKVLQSQTEQEEMEFRQDIYILVEQFNNQREQVKISKQVDSIAEVRYKTNYETFMIGQISTLDLNYSQTSKDTAIQNRISQLYLYWYYYYKLRSITLWDFAKNTGIDADFDSLVED